MRLSATLVPLLSILFVVASPLRDDPATLAKREVSPGVSLPVPTVGHKLIKFMIQAVYDTLVFYFKCQYRPRRLPCRLLDLSIDAASAYFSICARPNGNTFVFRVRSVLSTQIYNVLTWTDSR